MSVNLHSEGSISTEHADASVPAVRLSNWERITLADVSVVQKALSRMNSKVSHLNLPAAVLKARVEDIEKAIAFYREQRLENDPDSFYIRPSAVPEVRELGTCPLSRGEVVDLSFPTGYRPQHTSFSDEFHAYHENQTVHARLWRHPPGEELGTIVALHGWRMGDSRLSALTLIPGYFFRLGLNVALLELPYHAKRAPYGAQRGSYFPSANVVRTNEGFAQSIHDVRSLSLWLESQGTGPVGVLGISLGGYLASLWASLDKLKCVMCISPMVDMAEVAMNIIAEHRELLPNEGQRFFDSISEELLREAFAVHSPLSYAPKVSQDSRLVLAGVADEIIPASQPRKLSEHWGNCPVHWVSSKHLNHAIEPRTFQVLKEFLGGLGLAHSELLRISHRF